MVLLGLLAMPLILAKKQALISEVRTMNYGTLTDAKNGINQFFASGNGAYPCPANLFLSENDADFGMSSDCTFANVLECTDPSWKLAINGGICKTDNTADAIVIGALPFATVKMPQGFALDYWNNKIIYAVTHKQTDVATYVNGAGEIRLLAADDPVSVANGTDDGVPDLVTTQYDLVLLSTGLNARGGYSKDGVEITACGSALNGYDFENCNFDNTFMIDRDPGNNTASLRSDAAGVNYYDDWVLAQETPPVATWFQHEDNSTYPNDYVLTLSTKIGIGTTTPGDDDNTVSLDVIGPIRVQSDSGVGGRVKSDSICNNSDCFDPHIITEISPDMTCAAGSSASYTFDRPMTELSASSVKCTSLEQDSGGTFGDDNMLRVDTSIFAPGNCPVGERIIGFDATGAIVCAIQ